MYVGGKILAAYSESQAPWRRVGRHMRINVSGGIEMA